MHLSWMLVLLKEVVDVARKAEWRAGMKALETITFLLRISYGQEAANC